MVWAKYGLLGCATAIGVAVAMMGLDGYLRGAPEAMIGAALGLAAMALLGVRFVPGLVREVDAADALNDPIPCIDGLPEPESDAEIRNVPATVSETDTETKARASDAASIRLVPQVRPEFRACATSWFGGMPRLPADTAWPDLDGVPARFLAQIDCATLPAPLWDGLGPRQGSLAVFGFEPTAEGVWPVRVLHVDPEQGGADTPVDETPQARWPVSIMPDGAEIDSGEGPSPDWQRLHATDLSDPAFQPFDWTSASVLLGSVKTLLETAAARTSSDTDPTAYAQLAATARRLADLTGTLRQTRAHETFSAEACSELIQNLSDMILPAPDGSTVPLSAHPCLCKAYFAPFETYCRKVHTCGTGALPEAHRALLEPLWAHNARHETATMGAHSDRLADRIEAEDAVLLLALPSSELLGWSFGAGRALHVFVTRDALECGDLSEAWAVVSG